MSDYFDTPVIIENAVYEPKEQALLIFVIIALTGDKKILVEPKINFHYGSHVSGEFPDKFMYDRAEILNRMRGKRIVWRMFSDGTNQMTPEIVESMAHRVGDQMEEITEVISSDERVLQRKKEDLVAIEKLKAQEQARESIRKKLAGEQ